MSDGDDRQANAMAGRLKHEIIKKFDLENLDASSVVAAIRDLIQAEIQAALSSYNAAKVK